MNRRISYLILVVSAAVLFLGCSNKNSNDACLHQVTMDLDSGNYSAVINSTCADAMQKGGAYFGRAGFTANGVINTFIATGSSTSSSGTSTTTSSDLSIYMTSLVTTVTESTLSDLNNAETEYGTIATTSGSYLDAQFYIGLVDVVKSLSLLKSVLDITGTGTVVTTCDMNDNSVPDSLDATSCTLLISAGTATAGNISSACTASTSLVYDSVATVPTTTITFDTDHPGDYRGLILQTDGTGTNISGCSSPNQYKELLYWTSSGAWAVVTTDSGTPSCTGSDGNVWPCPMIENGQPLDLVSAFDSSLNSSISSLSTSLTGSNDVTTSITSLMNDACPSGTCTATDIANYLETY